MSTMESAPVEVQHGSQVGTPEIDSIALQRLIAEVRNEEPTMKHHYNRMHNRHNR